MPSSQSSWLVDPKDSWEDSVIKAEEIFKSTDGSCRSVMSPFLYTIRSSIGRFSLEY